MPITKCIILKIRGLKAPTAPTPTHPLLSTRLPAYLSRSTQTRFSLANGSSLLQLAPGSRNLSQAEKRLICKAEQIHKMTTIFTQNNNFVHPGQF